MNDKAFILFEIWLLKVGRGQISLSLDKLIFHLSFTEENPIGQVGYSHPPYKYLVSQKVYIHFFTTNANSTPIIQKSFLQVWKCMATNFGCYQFYSATSMSRSILHLLWKFQLTDWFFHLSLNACIKCKYNAVSFIFSQLMLNVKQYI